MTTMNEFLERALKNKLNEEKKPKWYSDPMKYRGQLADRIRKVAKDIEDISIGDRYYPDEVDVSKKLYVRTNRWLKIMDDAVFKLETEMLKAKKVK
jgi:hypothetical protein